jgi:hypothetical protein
MDGKLRSTADKSAGPILQPHPPLLVIEVSLMFVGWSMFTSFFRANSRQSRVRGLRLKMANQSVS